jgi:hypothetical protein
MFSIENDSFRKRAQIWVSVANEFNGRVGISTACPFCKVGTLTSTLVWKSSERCEHMIKCNQCDAITFVLGRH